MKSYFQFTCWVAASIFPLQQRNMYKSCQEFAFWLEFGLKNLCGWARLILCLSSTSLRRNASGSLFDRQTKQGPCLQIQIQKVAGWQHLDGNRCSHQRRWYALKSWENDCVMRKCLCGDKTPFSCDKHWTYRLGSLRNHLHFIVKSEGKIIVHMQGFSSLGNLTVW